MKNKRNRVRNGFPHSKSKKINKTEAEEKGTREMAHKSIHVIYVPKCGRIQT